MPKERFHLLLADECIKGGREMTHLSHLLGRERLAFYLGAISPDIFFYDLPSFTLDSFGERLHELIEQKNLAPIQEWLRERTQVARLEFSDRAGVAAAWGLGFASHFLADGLWHPTINSLAVSLDYCVDRKYSLLACHRLIESELESFWLPRSGDPGIYLGFLRDFTANRQWLLNISEVYRDFLTHAGLSGVPAASRIRRCFLIQNYLLRVFSNRVAGGWRDQLLNRRFGRYLGTLIAPQRCLLPQKLEGAAPERNPFSKDYMEERITSLKTRLSGFAKQLQRSLPS